MRKIPKERGSHGITLRTEFIRPSKAALGEMFVRCNAVRLLADGLLVAAGKLCFMGLVMWAIASGLQSGNACYHSVQNLVFQFAIQKYKD